MYSISRVSGPGKLTTRVRAGIDARFAKALATSRTCTGRNFVRPWFSFHVLGQTMVSSQNYRTQSGMWSNLPAIERNRRSSCPYNGPGLTMVAGGNASSTACSPCALVE